MTTSNRGTTAAIEKKNMELSRRNVQICEAKAEAQTGKAIAMQYGLAQSTVSVVLQQGLEHWQEWERRAVEAGVLQDGPQEVAGDPDNRGITMLPIDSIAPNPWQPRTEIDDNHIFQTAEDIFRQGLLFPILVRENGLEGGHELVDGQVRLGAFRYLDSLEWDPDLVTHNALDFDPTIDGTWASRYYVDGVTMIPAIVRFMSPSEVILASLSANVVRRDLSWLDETRAYKQALDADVGLSQRKLAQTVGISPTNMSTRLSMLKLPAPILDLINDGKLSWTAARELLGFVSQTHVHQEELEYMARALPRSRVLKDGRTLSASDVREFQLNAMGHKDNADKWEHMSMVHRNVYLGSGGPHRAAPVLDPKEFMDQNFDHLHTLPGPWGADHITWTCRGKKWRGVQDRWRVEEERKREEESARVAALTKDDEVPRHPEAGLHRRVEGPGYSFPAPTSDEVQSPCTYDREHKWELKSVRTFECQRCGYIYIRKLPEPEAAVVPVENRSLLEAPCSGWRKDGDDSSYCVEHDALAAAGAVHCEYFEGIEVQHNAEREVGVMADQVSRHIQEHEGQQQDMSMAHVPTGNTEPNVVSIDRTSEEVELHEDTWSYMSAVRDSLEGIVAGDVWPTREELWTLASNMVRARNSILSQLQGSFPDDAA